MKILIICSKKFYDRIPDIKLTLEKSGHTIILPNCFDAPGTEDTYRNMGTKEHSKWKASMLRQSDRVILGCDAYLLTSIEVKMMKIV